MKCVHVNIKKSDFCNAFSNFQCTAYISQSQNQQNTPLIFFSYRPTLSLRSNTITQGRGRSHRCLPGLIPIKTPRSFNADRLPSTYCQRRSIAGNHPPSKGINRVIVACTSAFMTRNRPGCLETVNYLSSVLMAFWFGHVAFFR